MSDGESVKHSSYTSSPASECTSVEATQQPELSHQEKDISFDLSDPNDLEVKLDQLSEEEMEALLAQAYKVNKELKKELHRQERVPSGKSNIERTKSKSSTSSAGKGLPPLRTTSGSRSFTSLNHRSSAQHHTPSPVNPSRHKAKTALQTPSTKPRPEWNERFNL